MAISPSAHRLDLDGQAALFCDRAQKLFQLNPTAADIWDKLSAGWSCQSIIDHFANEGLSASDARSFVLGIAGEWLSAGHMAPAEILSAAADAPRDVRRLRIGPASLSVRFFGTADLRSFDAVFGHLLGEDGSHPRHLDVVERDRTYFLVREGKPSGFGGPNQIIPLLKAVLTDDCCSAIQTGFLAHGALVSRNNKRVFITGSPGAGKTTLTMALLSEGYFFCGDDIVHIDEAGRAAGLPFAAAVKSGAWSLLGARYPALLKTDVHERKDGQLVRYVVPERRDTTGARPIDAVVILSRNTESRAATERLQPLQSLCEILASGYSPRQRLDAATIRALAENLCRASHHRLVYSDLPDAVAAISALT